MVLPPTPGDQRGAIVEALDRLEAGGSTNGERAFNWPTSSPQKGFVKGGINRVMLATDGDFNVGVTSQGDSIDLIEQKAKTGVFLTVLGFGMGNYNDATMEKLADKGNGNYAYIDTLNEAPQGAGRAATGTLMTIAKDVKIQIDFNPAAGRAPIG